MNPIGNHLSLFRKYPQLEKKLPYLNLGTYPTPIHPLQSLGSDNLWIKRDDQSSSIYGGNKIRKLEFILAAARCKKARHVVTVGAIGSNHGLATVIFCNQLGIRCTLMLYHQPVTENVKQTLLLLGKSGALLDYRKSLWRAMLGYYLNYRLKYPGAYFIYPGGSSVIGIIGYVNAAFELNEQIDQGVLPRPSAIFCPLSSGGTLAGLTLGIELAGLNTRVIGVRVMPSHLGPFQACTPKTVARQIQRTYGYLKSRSRDLAGISIREPEIYTDYLGSGYGSPTRAGSIAYRLMEEKEGIRLDPTYTAKTVAAVLKYCRSQLTDRGPVLYWHTYNSVDLSARLKSVDYRILPDSLQTFIAQPPVEF